MKRYVKFKGKYRNTPGDIFRKYWADKYTSRVVKHGTADYIKQNAKRLKVWEVKSELVSYNI
jgi:hypothetical protein